MNLYRFARQIGLKPVLCGNIKGLLDRYRTPATQAGFAARWGQQPSMVTSFADGTKLAFEQAVVANATGSGLLVSGMLGPTFPTGKRIEEAVSAFPVETLLDRGCVVDYVVGADPAPGVFILATCDHPAQRGYLDLYKLGAGPLYCLHTPFHLCHFEVPLTIARAVLYGDAAVRPLGGMAVEVVAIAKRDLPGGTQLDGIGGYDLFGQAVESAEARNRGLFPIGLSEGGVMRRSVRKDEPLRKDDVEVPKRRLVDALREEQDAFL
jgi:predicted homoserine dehydrogenase-like protein